MKSNLLLIDNGTFFQQNLGQRLRREGFQLFFGRQLHNVKEIISREKIDAALLDLSGLKMEGIRIIKALKSAGTPAEIITINSANQLAFSIDAMKLGAFDDFLIPIEINPLLDCIKAAVERKQTREHHSSFLSRKQEEITMADVHAETENTDEGETILIEKTHDTRNEKKQQSARENIKVLLVDDEEEFVNTLSERIGLRGLGVEIALNGNQALETVNTQAPDVMVLDLRMPGIDGMEVLRRIKKSHPEVQVIILSGHGSKGEEQEALKLGACKYLQKPVNLDVLIEEIRKACE